MTQFPKINVDIEKLDYEKKKKNCDFQITMGYKTDEEINAEQIHKEEMERNRQNIPINNYITTNIKGEQLEIIKPVIIIKESKNVQSYNLKG